MQIPSKQCARSILIADDQPAFRKLLRRMLSGLDADFIECPDGTEAIAAFERHQPDWALLDWMMPNLDGVSAARAIRARYPEARVVIISVSTSPLLTQEAANAGAYACFPKERMADLVALLRASPPWGETASPQQPQPI